MTLNHLRISIILFTFTIFLSTFSACISNKKTQENHISLLSKCWTHSHEDNTDELKTYLPCDAKDFPPSRYRARFSLSEDGSCSFSVLASNDAHTSESGTWTYNKETKVLVLMKSDGAVSSSYVVELLESNRMLLR